MTLRSLAPEASASTSSATRPILFSQQRLDQKLDASVGQERSNYVCFNPRCQCNSPLIRGTKGDLFPSKTRLDVPLANVLEAVSWAREAHGVANAFDAARYNIDVEWPHQEERRCPF